MPAKNIFITFLNPAIAFSVLLGAAISSYSQTIPLSTKEQFLLKDKQNLEDSINKQTEIELPFILGREHWGVTNKVNHPYVGENEWNKGTFVFKGQQYSAENLKYDVDTDKLIYLSYSSDFQMNCIALDQNFVSEFSIQNATFRYFDNLVTQRGVNLRKGYYEVVYDGKLKFLSRKIKSKSFDDNSLYLNYKLSTDLFLIKDGKLIRVKSMAKLIAQLSDKKKELKKYVRDNYLKLNLTDYSSAAKVLKFYEGL